MQVLNYFKDKIDFIPEDPATSCNGVPFSANQRVVVKFEGDMVEGRLVSVNFNYWDEISTKYFRKFSAEVEIEVDSKKQRVFIHNPNSIFVIK